MLLQTMDRGMGGLAVITEIRAWLQPREQFGSGIVSSNNKTSPLVDVIIPDFTDCVTLTNLTPVTMSCRLSSGHI